MSTRDIILGRIREALRSPAHHPGQHLAEAEPTVDLEHLNRQAWLPAVGERLEDQIRLFSENAAALKADFQRLPNPAAAIQFLQTLAHAEGWKKIASHHTELNDSVCQQLGLPVLFTDAGYAIPDLESCDAGISGCECLVAQTGSVLVSAPASGGRALSVLPPHHVVLARTQQLVSDLSVALLNLQKKYGGNYPSFVSFVTGPSRTGDIERILVLGAHGPKKLTVLLID